jgi:hypothetical protein
MVCIFDASALFEVSTGSIMHSETVGRVLGRSFWAESRHSLHLRDHTLRQVEADIHAILEGGRSLNRCKLARAVMQH